MIGQTISHYRILSKLGEGGMGVVYKAEDLMLQRTVALKFLPRESVASASDRSRLVHEARAAAVLLHPNICPVYEIGESDGRTFIAMGYLEGRSLKDRLTEGPLSLEEALRIVKEVGDGIAAAHGKGIIHRDVKPGNVMVTPEGRAVLMDFGLAKMTGSTKLTRTGATVGTVAYMSPEQMQGKEVDGRTDIWALGVMLYEMVSGELPFQGEYEPALFYAIVNAEPKPLASEKIPAGLDGILAKALAKRASDRYQTAREFIQDIDALLSDREAFPAGRAKSATGLRRAWRRWRPWERAVAVGATCIITAVVVAGVIALVRVRSTRDASKLENLALAVIEFRNSVNPDDPTVSSGITELVQVGLFEKSPIRPISPELLYDIRRRLFGSRRGSIEPDQILEVAKTAGSTLFLTGEMMGTTTEKYVAWRLVETKTGKSLGGRRVMGRTLIELADGIIDGALPLLAGRADAKLPASSGSVSEIVTASVEAYQHYMKGLLAREKLDGDREAIAEFERAVQLDSTFALAYYELAKISLGSSSREAADKAWTHRVRLNTRDRLRLEAFREYLVDPGLLPAMETYREILTRWPDDLEAIRTYSSKLASWWLWREGVAVSNQGRALYPDDQGLFVTSVESLAMSGNAREALDRSLAFVREHRENLVALETLGHAYLDVGLPDSMEAINRRILRNDPANLIAASNVGFAQYAKGNVNAAIETLEQILLRSGLSEADRESLFLRGRGISVYPGEVPAEVGRFSESFRIYEEIRHVEWALRVEARYLMETGQTAEAVRLARDRWMQANEAAKNMSRAVTRNDVTLVEALVAADSLKQARSMVADMSKVEERYLKDGIRYLVLLLPSKILLAEGAPEGALDSLRELAKLYPPTSDYYGYYYRETLARAYWKSGRLQEAVDTYLDLLKIFGGHAISRYELGQVYEQLGSIAEAKREYKKFLEMCSLADEGWHPVEDARRRLAAL